MGSEVIYNREVEVKFEKWINNENYFIQEIIPGKKEYTTHILFMDNRIISDLTIKYVYQNEIHLHGKDDSIYTKISSCPYLLLFASILKGIKFEGICCIDYIVTNGHPFIFEINPRIGASLSEFLFSFIHHLDNKPQLAE